MNFMFYLVSDLVSDLNEKSSFVFDFYSNLMTKSCKNISLELGVAFAR